MAATLQFNYSGGASNTVGDAALGGTHSSEALGATALNNLFDDVSPAEATAGDAEYRAVDVTNVGDATATSVSAYVSAPTSSPDTELQLGIESAAVGSTTAIANESTPPAGVTFAVRTFASQLSLPDIPAGSYARLWLARVVNAGAGNSSNDQATLAVDYA